MSKDIVKHPKGHWMEIDLYLPDERIAFEINGSRWHKESDEVEENDSGFCLTKFVGYHQWKSDRCSELGINLYHIDISQWYSKTEIENKISKYL